MSLWQSDQIKAKNSEAFREKHSGEKTPLRFKHQGSNNGWYISMEIMSSIDIKNRNGRNAGWSKNGISSIHLENQKGTNAMDFVEW